MRIVFLALLVACGSGPEAKTPARCPAEVPAPSIHARHAPASGGANAWFELGVSHVDSDQHVFLDETEVPIARETAAADDDHAMDATAGQLQPKSSRAAETKASSHVVGFRIPASAAPGPHAVSFRTCGATSETIAYDVLPNPAPVVSGVRVVRGAVWSSLLITGSNLAGAAEVVLVAADGSVLPLGNVTRVDDGQLKVAVEKNGTYDVFVRSANGLGGGPPNGVVTIR